MRCVYTMYIHIYVNRHTHGKNKDIILFQGLDTQGGGGMRCI